jgi:ParB-like chromosome segregation protein Spo0J
MRWRPPLRPYARNARTHSDEQVAQIAASILELGLVNLILEHSNAEIITGHGRLLAAGKPGLAALPVVVLDHLSEIQRSAHSIADNSPQWRAKWRLAGSRHAAGSFERAL